MSDYSSMPTSENNINSADFQTALERVKLVAAKLKGGGNKRPLDEGLEPHAKKMASADAGYIHQQHNQMGAPSPPMASYNMSSSPPMSQSGNMPPNGPPGDAITENIRVPDKMVGLIIGRNGEQITRLQAESGCKIQMAPPSNSPDRICTLTGSKDAIARARELVKQIVNLRGRENAGPNDMMGGPPMMGMSNNAPPQNNMNRPGGGGGGGGGGSSMEEIMIPGLKVGLIIGKNGKTIKQLQEQSGAKMVVIQDGPKDTDYDKPLRISGDPSKVEHAKQLVYELLTEKEPNMGGGPNRQYNDYQDQGNGMGGNNTKILVPENSVPVVIGKSGDMIKKIQAETGCRVQFHQNRDDGPGDKWCYLQGKPHQIEAAKQMIEDIISSVTRMYQAGRGRAGDGSRNGDRDNQWNEQGQEVRVTFTVNNLKCGLIIGRGGEVIKQINAISGAHCELDRRAQNTDRNNRTFYIKGMPDNVEHCKQIIMDKCGMPVNFIHESESGAESPSGNGNGAWGYEPHWHSSNNNNQQQQQQQQQQPMQQMPQVQINPVTGQPDYSQLWIEYYRSIGHVKEAEVVEMRVKQQQQQQQQQQGGGGGGPAPSSTPTPQSQSGTVDYSLQWAEYYRSMGKIKEAEAIEAQVAMKQQQPASAPAETGPAPEPETPQMGNFGYQMPFPQAMPYQPYPYPYQQEHHCVCY